MNFKGKACTCTRVLLCLPFKSRHCLEQFECCEKKIDDEIDEQVMDDKSGTKHTVSLSKTKLWEEKYEKQVG